MPKAWSNKDERQYEHIKDSAKNRGRSTKRAKEIAAATVNKNRAEEGRAKTVPKKGSSGRKKSSASVRGGKKGGKRSSKRR